ncbi:SapB/AmfS family lanthipeptide [Streptomyces ipomoeae]|nr:SapB/AmfS family lanthipeptide [Streptomyces ipomoeae]MDX2938654.1 SapB/AmfS family lanthipeptide [Streptomyces ipomoeae]TQE18434.1 SapB/AmfS family lantipeptide [Streptomyces ipomoeae]
MILLDLQTLEPEETREPQDASVGGSGLSLLLCESEDVKVKSD